MITTSINNLSLSGLQRTSLKQNIKPQINSVLTFKKASEESIKARNIAKRLYKATKPSDWKEPFLTRWFNPCKATRVYESKEFGKVIVELFPINKQELVRVPTFVGNKSEVDFKQASYEAITARMVIPSEGIDITTQEHYHPVMQLALDVVRDDSGIKWF